MKLTALLLTLTILSVSAKTLAQRVTLHQKNVPIDQVLNEIRKQTGYDVIYDENKIRSEGTVSIDVSNTQLKDVLGKLFTGRNFDFTIANNAIIIRAKDPTLFDKFKAVFQAIDIHGRVVDETGKALPGVTVKIKDGNQATITNANGDFELKQISAEATLVFSFVGYASKEIKGDGDLKAVRMEVSDSKLDEVQIIAYGQTNRRLSTGNISTVKAADIEQQPVTNPLLALAGRVSGLTITQSSGLPGSGVVVRIQGQNSIASGNDPLYVIDGVPYMSQLLPSLSDILGTSGNAPGIAAGQGNPLSFINPQDIESIDVLKDASATSIYGSRAANGAILITTKKGKAGVTDVTFNVQNGIGRVSRMLPLLNTTQYLEMRNEALKNDGITTPGDGDYDINGLWDKNRYTDWQKELIGGTANYTDAQATVSGGNSNTQFLIGGGYHRETTVLPGNLSDQKGSMHFNLNHSALNNRFKISFSSIYQYDNNKLISSDLTSTAITLAPNAPVLYNSDGSLNWAPSASGSSSWDNPMAYLLRKYNNITNNLIGNANFSYRIADGLTLRTNMGYTKFDSKETTTNPLVASRPEDQPYTLRSAGFATRNSSTWIIEPQLNYEKALGAGVVNALVGSTFQNNQSDLVALGADGFINDNLLTNIGAAANIHANNTISSKYRYNALFARINYNLNNEFIFELAGRRDGSSRFGTANRFHNFGSLSGAWIFTEEKYFKEILPFISFGKLKLSYGTTGNDQIPDYNYMSLYSSTGAAVPYQSTPGLLPTRLTNPYLQWENTQKIQGGIDLGFLSDQLILTANYAVNRSSNLLMPYLLPISAGFGSITRNFPATVQNKTWEFNLNATILKSIHWKWNSALNLTIPQNKLISFPNISNSSYASLLIVGESITATRVAPYAGVNTQTGVYQFYDGKGGLTSSPDLSNIANTTIITNGPRWYGGLQNSVSFKNIQLDFSLQYIRQKGLDYSLGNIPGYFNTNQPTWVLNRWQKPGDKAQVQQFTTGANGDVILPYYSALSSNANYGDASFLRLKTVSLSWGLPSDWLGKMSLKRARVYANAQNLFTVTKYKGLDPENLNYYALPALRVITFGLQLTL